jgi:ketosteroid isomerase-like protein
MRAKDLDRLMAFHAPDVVYFDIVPPLRYVGAAALRARFADWFGRFDGPIGLEVRDLDASVSGDVAAAHMLVRASGTLVGGPVVGYWVRATTVLRRSEGRWAITHEHVSAPVDLASRSAVLDLEP